MTVTNNVSRRVVVTGLGALSSLGHDVSSLWRSLCNGESGAAPIASFDASALPVRIACEIRDLNFQDYFSSKEINRIDPLSMYALLTAREAVRDAGLSSVSDPERCGVIWSSGNGGIQSLENHLLHFDAAAPRFSPYLMPKILIDTPSGMIALELGWKGVNFCPVAACASSTVALVEAFNLIRLNKADILLAGGSEAPVTQTNIGAFAAMKALSTRNDSPATASRPLDRNRDGFVMGEGAGALVLEELEHARQRGARIYAEIAGGGVSNDAFHATSTHPEGEGAQLAIRMALKEAGISAHEFDYVNLHATGTLGGDLSEVRALAGMIDPLNRRSVHLSATKSATGHLLGAAGALEGVISVKALTEQCIPPTINLDQPDEEIPDGFTLVSGRSVQPERVEYVLSNSFGFGGHNASIIFRRY